VIEQISEEELHGIIARRTEELDKLNPEWRTAVASCCLYCADLSTQELELLNAIYNAQWLLTGIKYHKWAKEVSNGNCG
jgi:hypothetical protein